MANYVCSQRRKATFHILYIHRMLLCCRWVHHFHIIHSLHIMYLHLHSHQSQFMSDLGIKPASEISPTQFDSLVLFSTSAGREGRCDALYTLHSEFDRRDSGALPLVLAIRHGPRWLQWRQTWPDALVSQLNVLWRIGGYVSAIGD